MTSKRKHRSPKAQPSASPPPSSATIPLEKARPSGALRARGHSRERPDDTFGDDAAASDMSDGYDANAGPLDTGLASIEASLAREAVDDTIDGTGLSLDPGNLGFRALKDALGTVPSEVGARDALIGIERETDLTPEASAEPSDEEDLGEPAEDEAILDSEDASESDEDAISPTEPSQVDLTQNVIDEGSLFDQPRNEGGVRHPLLRTNEVDATLERNERARKARKRGV